MLVCTKPIFSWSWQPAIPRQKTFTNSCKMAQRIVDHWEHTHKEKSWHTCRQEATTQKCKAGKIVSEILLTPLRAKGGVTHARRISFSSNGYCRKGGNNTVKINTPLVQSVNFLWKKMKPKWHPACLCMCKELRFVCSKLTKLTQKRRRTKT